jgi:hypothetical protein
MMSKSNGNNVPKPTVWRLVLVYVVFVAVSGGVMALLGERPAWSAFAAVGTVFVLGMIKRWKDAGGGR